MASRQSLRDIQTWWTDEDIATALDVLEEQAAAAAEQTRR